MTSWKAPWLAAAQHAGERADRLLDRCPLDYDSVLEQYLRRLCFESEHDTGSLMVVPPAEGAKIITADQVALYPSPTLDVATAPSGLKDHSPTRWQAAVADALQSCPTNWGSGKWGWFFVTAMRLKMAAFIAFSKRCQSCFEKRLLQPIRAFAGSA